MKAPLPQMLPAPWLVPCQFRRSRRRSMSSQLDPEVGRDDPSPHAPKSADFNDENSSAPKESSGQTDEHQAMAAEPQVPVARPLDDARSEERRVGKERSS